MTVAESTDLRTRAAEAAALAIGVENGPGGEDFLIADAVLAAVLPDLAERLTALAAKATTPSRHQPGLLRAANEIRRLAATGPPNGVPGENGDAWCCAKCKKLAEEGL